MDYKIDDVDQVTDWLSSFEALSTVQFEKFSRRLYFPVQISPDLREVAKQFCLAVLNHRTNFNSEYPPPELPVDPLFVPSENIDPLIQIWMNTFSHLKTVGYDEIVYRWGKKIQQIEVISNPVSGSQWFGILKGWAEDGFDPEVPLDLPDNTVAKLKSIIVQCIKDTRELYTQAKEAMRQRRISDDSWERYVAPFSWVVVTGHRLGELLLLKEIFSLLSPDSLKILDQWGNEIFKTHSWLELGYFSLVEFAGELDKHASIFEMN